MDGADGAVGADSVRGNRYCELLVVTLTDGALEAQVWGTQGLNDCPAAAWDGIDVAALGAELGAVTVVRNGPRHWLIDEVSAVIPDGPTQRFGELEMRRLATIAIAAGDMTSVPYRERTIRRDSRFVFHAGAEVFELLAPDGAIYVMQSYALSADPSLDEAALRDLGGRLALPAGWSYRARTLATALVIDTPGEAIVVQDELQDSYSRYVAAP